jgi:hypothetical protein
MRFILTLGLIIPFAALFAQNELVPMQSFYKDQLFANKNNSPYIGGDFLPVNESEYDLIPLINDSSKQYYDFTETLFKKHLFEIRGDNFSIDISPVVDFTVGRDLADTSSRTLFQNTRGAIVSGELGNNFSFSTSFYENQARFSQYQSAFYQSRGELYPGASSYQSQNAVIPGAARTKPFKGDAFDYAFALGYISYAPTKSLRITAGNNPHFIGSGHRSLLLSDNSYASPYFKINYQPAKWFKFEYLRSRLINLVRRPVTSSVEAYYETKGFAVNYWTFVPTENISISFFEGTVWNRGDSIISKYSNPLIYNPIPLLAPLALEHGSDVYALYGLNWSAQITKNHRVYGQVASAPFSEDITPAIQLGYRGYRFFGSKDLMVQLEMNTVPNGLYHNITNRRLNYSHYNLPLSHIQGAGFNELLGRFNYEFKRLYIDETLSYYNVDDREITDLLSVSIENPSPSRSFVVSRTELGYRFNRKMNLCLFGSLLLRSGDQINANTVAVFAGLKTSIFNQYYNF